MRASSRPEPQPSSASEPWAGRYGRMKSTSILSRSLNHVGAFGGSICDDVHWLAQNSWSCPGWFTWPTFGSDFGLLFTAWPPETWTACRSIFWRLAGDAGDSSANRGHGRAPPGPAHRPHEPGATQDEQQRLDCEPVTSFAVKHPLNQPRRATPHHPRRDP